MMVAIVVLSAVVGGCIAFASVVFHLEARERAQSEGRSKCPR
jgi:hypothetical protein